MPLCECGYTLGKHAFIECLAVRFGNQLKASCLGFALEDLSRFRRPATGKESVGETRLLAKDPGGDLPKGRNLWAYKEAVARVADGWLREHRQGQGSKPPCKLNPRRHGPWN